VTSVPLDLPLRPAEAAAVGALIFEQAERRPLTDEIRNRIAARTAVLRLDSVTLRLLSLARDPIHPSSYYFAADAGGQPMLLHVAPAAAPTSSVFSKPLLIGRMRHAGSQEMIINAIPFGPADEDNIEKFVSRVDTAFLPRPQGLRPAIVVDSNLPEAFDAFRAIWKRTGRNLAAVAAVPGVRPRQSYYAAVWAAVRSGWREGYTAGIDLAIAGESLETAKEIIREAPGFTRFGVDVASIPERGIEVALEIHEFIRQTRSARKISRSFDFEIALGPVDVQQAGDALEWLYSHGHATQLLVVGVDQLEELDETARRRQCLLSVSASPDHTLEVLESVGRATKGRFNYKTPGRLPDLATIAEHLLG